jgi:hypothetical protein
MRGYVSPNRCPRKDIHIVSPGGGHRDLRAARESKGLKYTHVS